MKKVRQGPVYNDRPGRVRRCRCVTQQLFCAPCDTIYWVGHANDCPNKATEGHRCTRSQNLKLAI